MTSSCCPPTRRPASRRGRVSTRRCHPSPAWPCASSTNTTVAAPGPTWPPSMSTAPRCLAAASARPASRRSSDSSTKSCISRPTTKRAGSSGSWTMAPRIAARAACARLQAQYPRLVPVHGPVHASWLNQIEIYFSIIQRKVLTPNDFPSLAAVERTPARISDPLRGHGPTVRVEIHASRSCQAPQQVQRPRRPAPAHGCMSPRYVCELMNQSTNHPPAEPGAFGIAAPSKGANRNPTSTALSNRPGRLTRPETPHPILPANVETTHLLHPGRAGGFPELAKGFDDDSRAERPSLSSVDRDRGPDASAESAAVPTG